MENLPRPGIESMSPSLAGGFFSTEPSGKPTNFFFLIAKQYIQGKNYYEWEFSNVVKCDRDKKHSIVLWVGLNLSEPLPLNYELHNCFSAFSPCLGGTA